MSKDEALKQALEALELNNDEWKSLADSGDCGYWNAEDQDHYKQTNKAITAIKQALAAPVQEPVAWMQSDEVHISLWKDDYHTIPLYTAPPAAQRQWVGLSQDELDAMFSNTIKGKKLVNWVARAIEAKLKEKNT
jgi:hypothetical protein